MPIVNVKRDELFSRLGENYGAQKDVPSKQVDDKFADLCFEFGIELDDVTSMKEMIRKEQKREDANASEEIIYKVDVPANRYDLLCIEGLARALRIFKGKEKSPIYRALKPKQPEKMIVEPETGQIRPFVVCAILRNIKFNPSNYQSFIDLQEKLHQNICRRRTLVSIGTHDLDTIKGPFTYKALPPTEINFVPLNQTKSFNGKELMNHLENDLHLKKYLPIIRDSPRYPVIYDSNQVVLSLPPIINSDHSKITLNTKNVFIEVTATDLTKAKIVLNTVCAMFSEYTSDKFTSEIVEVITSDGKSTFYPDFSVYNLEVDVDYITSLSGIGASLKINQIADLLDRMSLTTTIVDDKKVSVAVPITRSDVLHACDVVEDVAISFGYNNIQRVVPQTLTTGKQVPINKFTDQLREVVGMYGFTEVLTFALV